MVEKTISIEGMNCQHCVMAVRKNIEILSGVSSSEIEVGKARVFYDENKVTGEELEKAVEKAGFKVRRG